MSILERRQNPSEQDPTFGRILRNIRVRDGFPRNLFAGILNIPQTELELIEDDMVSPPLQVAFYERLQKLPGMTVEDLRKLMHSKGAPQYLLEGKEDPDKLPNIDID